MPGQNRSEILADRIRGILHAAYFSYHQRIKLAEVLSLEDTASIKCVCEELAEMGLFPEIKMNLDPQVSLFTIKSGKVS